MNLWTKLRLLLRPPARDAAGDDWESMSDDLFLLVGLGNPGREYRANRHNVGFMAVDRLAQAAGIASDRVEQRAIVGKGRLADQRVLIAKPQTFMNASGDAVGALLNYYKIAPARLLVIYDELDLPLGTLRLRPTGSAGGHNGMRSIIRHVGEQFPRLRLGIGRPPGRMPAAAYVLQDFAAAEQPIVDEMLASAVRAVDSFLRDGIDLAMSRHNGSIVER